MSVGDWPSGPAVRKCLLLKERKKGFQSPWERLHFCRSRTSTTAQMQAWKPKQHEATSRQGTFLQGRVTEGEEIQLHCHKGGPTWKSLWSENRQDAPLPGEPPVKSSMPKGWEATPKPTGPSDHHLRAPGHMASNPANKRSLPPNSLRPGSKVHTSYASWQAIGQHQAPHWALGRKKSFHLCSWPPSLQLNFTPDPGIICNKLITRRNPSLFFSGQWRPLLKMKNACLPRLRTLSWRKRL